MVIAGHKAAGRNRGPEDTGQGRSIIAASKLNEKIHLLITRLRDDGCEFPVDIDARDKIIERFLVHRSLR